MAIAFLETASAGIDLLPQPGEHMKVRGNSAAPVMWTASRRLPAHRLSADPNLRPVRIAAGALGPGLPARDVLLSPFQRIHYADSRIRRWFGREELPVAAIYLTCLPGIARIAPADVVYRHLLFEQAQAVQFAGLWLEMAAPNDPALGPAGNDGEQELLRLFPELITDRWWAAARRPRRTPPLPRRYLAPAPV